MARSRPRLSLLEAALLLCIVGIVLAVFIPTFARRVRTNKVLEASEVLQELSQRTASYYAADWNADRRHCLPPSAGPTPKVPTVEAEEVDFFSPEALGHTTWEALEFQPERPVRYSYRFTPSESGCDLGAESRVVWSAEGDLDGDGVRSVFERHATPMPDGTLQTNGTLRVHRRVE
ncbi:MAG: hypothetical protein AAF997_12705 [Myxococcota bacterium]